MEQNNSIILNKRQIQLKIRRIAYEIAENNHKESSIYLWGIENKGPKMAELIDVELSKIFSKRVVLIHNETEQPGVFYNSDNQKVRLENKTVVIVDDVMNTGITLTKAFLELMNNQVKKVEIAVLINRKHTNFPIAIKYNGYELATTLSEHIEVSLEDEPICAYLFDQT